jgi:hypothetical protein
MIQKTPNAIRTNIVPAEVMALLQKYRAWQNEQILKCGDQWRPEWFDHPRLFTQWDGLY